MDARAIWSKVMGQNVNAEYALGPNTLDRWINDPKRLGFMLARYKFAAKMLSQCNSILEVGCGDGFGSVTFLSDTKAQRIVCLDYYAPLIEHARNDLYPALVKARPKDAHRISFGTRDFFNGSGQRNQFEGLVSLDCIEHIDPKRSYEFIGRMADSLVDHGIAVVGTPNALAAQYASPHSKIGHVNLLSPDQLREELSKKFKTVFLFSMNDELVHCGFDKLGHYILAVAVK